MSQIYFHYLNSTFQFHSRNYLKKFLQSLFKKEKTHLISLHYIFCSDKYLLDINKEFLNHDYFTDIITFNLGSKENVEGEIYISIDRVRENAKLQKTSFKEELHRVIFHGALHLCGYKDKLKEEQLTMRKMEDRYLHKYLP